MRELSNICAVIVTHNRREKLLRSIHSVLMQTRPVQHILIIDNASSDDTVQAVRDLDNPIIEIETQPCNRNAAGGYFRGCELGYEHGYDKLWLMDDDCYPDANCLEVLDQSLIYHHETNGRSAGWAAPRVRTQWTGYDENSQPYLRHDHSRYFSDSFNCLMADYALWLGLLIPAWQFRDKGYPREEYGMWYDDEWTYRASREHPGIYVLKASVFHDCPSPTHFDGYSGITDDTLWKHVSCTRNIASHRLETGGERSYRRYCEDAEDLIQSNNLPEKYAIPLRQALVDGYTFKPPIRFPVS